MQFPAIQQTISERITADPFFQARSLVARKGFSARVSADGDLDKEVSSDLEAFGISLVVGMPQIGVVDATRSGRALMVAKVEIDIVENPTRNRSSHGVDIDPNTIGVEVFQALLAHPEIDPHPEKNFIVTHDEQMGLFVYQCSFAVQSMVTGRS